MTMMKKNKNLISEERRTHDLLSVAKMMKPLAKNLLGKYGFTELELLANWLEIAGDLAEYTLPKNLFFTKGQKTNGTLVVEVLSGAFALELQHREKLMLSKINMFFGYEAVAHLKIVQNNEMPIQDIDDVGNSQKVLVSDEEENYIQSISYGLENQELKTRLISLGRHIIGNNKGKKEDDF
ncbi:MAG: DUF721 domain-containing protein [Alphaproteobacteria bacterium]|nr:DUF721 domain-containing protein [Alphaproteobacteria bacterium]